jgi:hypothetical protein
VLLGAEVHLDGAAGAFSKRLTEHCRDEAVQLRLLIGQVYQRDPRVWRWNKAHVAGVQRVVFFIFVHAAAPACAASRVPI